MSEECCGPSARTQIDARTARAETELRQNGSGADLDQGQRPASWWRDPGLRLPIAAGVLLAAGWAFELAGVGLPATIALAASLMAGAFTFVPGAIRRLLKGQLGVGLLMTIAATGAVLLGHVGEAAALAFLFSIAEALEDRAMDRAKYGLRALLNLMPPTARLSKIFGEVVVPAASVREFDVLAIRPGEKVATDGVVVSGHSSLDTSAVTGESIPVEVGPGDAVPAGAINGGGALSIEATADGSDNSLTTIVRLVEEAHARKGDRARLADRIARPIVPGILILATLIVLFGFIVGDPQLWFERALVVLVAASPCALAIAVPVTVISAIGSASKLGVVIKSGAAFERLGAVRRVAFDKTGTLTRNRPQVVEVATASGIDRDAVLEIAAALEAHSTHPLAAAITQAAPTTPTATATDIVEHPGQGLTGTTDGRIIRVGNTRWIDAGPLQDPIDTFERDGMTVVIVERDGSVVGAIGVRDELRPEAAEMIRMLRSAGVAPSMLTGDNRRTAEALGSRLALGDVRAELLPQDKAAAVVASSTQQVTAMVGDGINDAPALAAADVGIAMGASGSAAAVESADVAFIGNDLRLIPQALSHARRGRSIMTANIALSLAIIIVLLPLALFGVLGLAAVVLIHEIAEVIVILNGVRAARRPRTT